MAKECVQCGLAFVSPLAGLGWWPRFLIAVPMWCLGVRINDRCPGCGGHVFAGEVA